MIQGAASAEHAKAAGSEGKCRGGGGSASVDALCLAHSRGPSLKLELRPIDVLEALKGVCPQREA